MSEQVHHGEQPASPGALIGRGAPSHALRRWRRILFRVLVVMTTALSLVIGLNSQAMAAGEFENNQTRMIIRDHGRYVGTVEVAIWTTNRPRGDVHAKVWGPGFSGWTRPEDVGPFRTYRGWVRVDRVLPDGAKVCAEGFWGDSSVGLPCATIEQ